MSVSGRTIARRPVPGAAPSAEPPEDTELSTLRGGTARQFVKDAPPFYPVDPPRPRPYHRGLVFAVIFSILLQIESERILRRDGVLICFIYFFLSDGGPVLVPKVSTNGGHESVGSGKHAEGHFENIVGKSPHDVGRDDTALVVLVSMLHRKRSYRTRREGKGRNLFVR